MVHQIYIDKTRNKGLRTGLVVTTTLAQLRLEKRRNVAKARSGGRAEEAERVKGEGKERAPPKRAHLWTTERTA